MVHLILVGISTCLLLPANKLKPRVNCRSSVATKGKADVHKCAEKYDANVDNYDETVVQYDEVQGLGSNVSSEKEKFLESEVRGIG